MARSSSASRTVTCWFARMQAAQASLTDAIKAEDAAGRKGVADGFANVASGRARSDWVNLAVVLAALAALGLAARAASTR